MPEQRIEFGFERTKCACSSCITNCKFMPGFLLPSDLARMIPSDVDPFIWAEANLLASPGALVAKGEELFRIPTLVPAVKLDRSCIHLNEENRCDIHEIAPFGCAFFDCGPERGEISRQALIALIQAGADSLYYRLWRSLDAKRKRQEAPEVLRKRMAECA